MEAMSPEGYMYYYNTETGGEFRLTKEHLGPHLYLVVFMHHEYQDFT